MKVILDHDVPHRLRRHFPPEHEASTARYMGWEGLKNGDLLKAAHEAAFDVLVTIDQGIPYQQSLQGLGLAVIVLANHPNHLPDLVALMPRVLAILEAKPEHGRIYHITP